MIITLFFFSAFLGIVRYINANGILVTLVSQSPEVYAGIAMLFLFLRLGMAVCKFYPMVVSFFRSITRMSEMAEDLFGRGSVNSGSRSSSKGGPMYNGNPKRQYHSSCVVQSRDREILKLTTGQCTLRGDNYKPVSDRLERRPRARNSRF